MGRRELRDAGLALLRFLSRARGRRPSVKARPSAISAKPKNSRVIKRGAKIYGATLTPYEGAVFHGYYQPEGEAKREAVNAWIRNGGYFDAVIDFDAAVRDPDHPTRIRPEFDVDDHLHPNDAGYRAMGDAVDLNLFEWPRGSPSARPRAVERSPRRRRAILRRRLHNRRRRREDLLAYAGLRRIDALLIDGLFYRLRVMTDREHLAVPPRGVERAP
jgi:hypothetical protein